MTREEQLKFCSVCQNRAFNPKNGIVCKLTGEQATFEVSCPDYIVDQSEVHMEILRNESRKMDAKKPVNRGRYALFIIGGLFILAGLYEAFIMPGADIFYGSIDWGVAAVFIGLGVWSFYKASLAMIVGLSFYLLIIIFLAVVDPTTIVSGIIWKILIVTLLFLGIKASREQEAKEKPKHEELLDQVD